jgi:hypothetical protein
MPVIPSLVLTGQFPGNTYSASLLTSASFVADGLGNQITSLKVTSSYSQTASYSVSQISTVFSASFASQSLWATSASYASASTWTDSASFSSESINTVSSSWASESLSSSWNSFSISSSNSLTSSYFSPSAGAVSDAGDITGSVSASGYGFSTDVEFNNFVTSLSSSLQSLNTLLADLRSKGLIT